MSLPEGGTTLRVRANTNVLGMDVNTVAELPADFPELEACLRLGFVSLLGPNDEVVAPPPPRGCGCGGR